MHSIFYIISASTTQRKVSFNNLNTIHRSIWPVKVKKNFSPILRWKISCSGNFEDLKVVLFGGPSLNNGGILGRPKYQEYCGMKNLSVGLYTSKLQGIKKCYQKWCQTASFQAEKEIFIKFRPGNPLETKLLFIWIYVDPFSENT